MAAKGSLAWAGWIVFTSTMLLVVAMVNIFEGLIVLLDDDTVALTREHLVVAGRC